jgi:hypothetical protein
MAEDGGREITAALAKLAAQDAGAAGDAGAALEWIAGEQDLRLVTQERIQTFCWHELPVKWMTSLDDKVGVAGALARALDLLNLPRYAAICRPDTTRGILGAYEASTEKGKPRSATPPPPGFRRPISPSSSGARRWGSRRRQRCRQLPTSWSWPSPAVTSCPGRGAGRPASKSWCELTSTFRGRK